MSSSSLLKTKYMEIKASMLILISLSIYIYYTLLIFIIKKI